MISNSYPLSVVVGIRTDRITGFISKFRKGLTHVITPLSPVWTPEWAGQPVTASDISEQDRAFRLDEGDVRISCYWRGQHKNNPAYVQVSWKANITTPGQLYVRFVKPDTQDILSELLLGTSLVGEEVFTSSELGFDPFSQKWAISIIFIESE